MGFGTTSCGHELRTVRHYKYSDFKHLGARSYMYMFFGAQIPEMAFQFICKIRIGARRPHNYYRQKQVSTAKGTAI